MAVNDEIKQFFEQYKNIESAWSFKDGCILLSCVEMYQATQDLFYRDFVFEYMNDLMCNKHTRMEGCTDKLKIIDIYYGKVLLWMYHVSLKDEYKKAVEELIKPLRAKIEKQSIQLETGLQDASEAFLHEWYITQSFYVEYETVFGYKEHYSDILKEFEKVNNIIFNSEVNVSQEVDLRIIELYLMTLIDTLNVMSMEIFEYYKALEEMFKKALNYFLKSDFRRTSNSAPAAYAILKACNKGVLLSEKYWFIGEELLDSLIQNKLDFRDLLSSDVSAGYLDTSAIIMAYAQFISKQ
ncbi:glycoside hydrolase family 88 protein [Anaeromicropila populeti]|uniref:Rhamnogalacturonyl hydrolase YesR n=1 Tax=Anaeromicropila populeti TaxID=37658 RepID=A0A1I6I955_9FIRM|nr:glycoside hydrolase family 88 protein [Anaeromicropila populeti]SFR63287.1 Rhamnogalacturonyl hydrolase YesR [Anaeromicropila populeti]